MLDYAPTEPFDLFLAEFYKHFAHDGARSLDT